MTNSGSMATEAFIRELQSLEKIQMTVLSDRRKLLPWGLAGGAENNMPANFTKTSAISEMEPHALWREALRLQ